VTLLSIVTVAWNAEATIADTMRSISSQSFRDYEHIVVDGASTDGTVKIVQALGDERTRLLSEPDNGLYDAMNKGFQLAQGRYVGFLNADDFFIRTDALSLIARASEPMPAAVSAAVAIVNSSDPSRWRRSYSANHFRPWMLRFGNMPPHPGFYACADAVTAIGGFRTDFKISADFDWMLRFYRSGLRPAVIPETLVAVRDGGASNSGFASRRVIAKETERALREQGVGTSSALIWSKYAAKAAQFLIPPIGFPAPAAVRWGPGKPKDDHA
jgi:glycosyltransferase involved in cell wall biosynthesis